MSEPTPAPSETRPRWGRIIALAVVAVAIVVLIVAGYTYYKPFNPTIASLNTVAPANAAVSGAMPKGPQSFTFTYRLGSQRHPIMLDTATGYIDFTGASPAGCSTQFTVKTMNRGSLGNGTATYDFSKSVSELDAYDKLVSNSVCSI